LGGEVAGANILVFFGVYEKDDIVISDPLLVDLVLELVVGHQFERSSRDVLIDNQISSSAGDDFRGLFHLL
jgi:hypothetical protein